MTEKDETLHNILQTCLEKHSEIYTNYDDRLQYCRLEFKKWQIDQNSKDLTTRLAENTDQPQMNMMFKNKNADKYTVNPENDTITIKDSDICYDGTKCAEDGFYRRAYKLTSDMYNAFKKS